jgi:poly(A)-specific ribonuclease
LFDIQRNNFWLIILAGISYLSRVQESLAREKIFTRPHQLLSSPNTSVADSVFMNRIKSRIVNWRKRYADPSKKHDGSNTLSFDKCLQLTALAFHFDGS